MTMEMTPRDTCSVTIVVASIMAVLLMFLFLLAIGNPDAWTGSDGGSIIYSVLIYIPVAMVCAVALVKSRRS